MALRSLVNRSLILGYGRGSGTSSRTVTQNRDQNNNEQEKNVESSAKTYETGKPVVDVLASTCTRCDHSIKP